MKVLLIGNIKTSGDDEDYYQEYAGFFQQVATKTKIDFALTYLHNLYIEVGEGAFRIYDTKTQTELKDYDIVILRGKGFRGMFDVLRTVSLYGQTNNIRVINDYQKYYEPSKLSQMSELYVNGFPIIKTVYLNDSLLTAQELPFEFPCIMKDVYGAHGEDNYLVESFEEIKRILKNSPKTRFILQRFVSNEGDYRVLIAGQNHLVIKRYAKGRTHLNNTSQGGTAELVDELSDKILKRCHKIAQNFDMDFAGVDIIIDKNTGEHFCLEVNSQPQVMTGAFSDKKVDLVVNFFENLNRSW